VFCLAGISDLLRNEVVFSFMVLSPVAGYCSPCGK
jgi:hypothetical protein